LVNLRKRNSMSHYIFLWLCGGMAFCAVARTHEMLKPENFINQSLFLKKSRMAPVLVATGFLGILAASALFGWHHMSLLGTVLYPFQVFIAGTILNVAITKGLSRRRQHSFFLNPIIHLFVLPWVFIVRVVVVVLA